MWYDGTTTTACAAKNGKGCFYGRVGCRSPPAPRSSVRAMARTVRTGADTDNGGGSEDGGGDERDGSGGVG